MLFSTPNGPLNVNQQNVANALTSYFNRNGGIPFAFAALNPAGLTTASGELPTASQQTTSDAMNLFTGPAHRSLRCGVAIRRPRRAAARHPMPRRLTRAPYAANGKARIKDKRDAYAAIYRKRRWRKPTIRWSVWGAAGFGGAQTAVATPHPAPTRRPARACSGRPRAPTICSLAEHACRLRAGARRRAFTSKCTATAFTPHPASLTAAPGRAFGAPPTGLHVLDVLAALAYALGAGRRRSTAR